MNPALFTLKKAPRGFSLVEIMVALALSLLLLAGVVAIFASSRASYEATDHLARVQENGRFALDQLVRDIRSAGFVGCARSPTYLSTSLNDNAVLQWNFLDGPVRGYQYTSAATWLPALDTSVTSPADGSDVLVLRIPKPDAEPLRLQSPMASNTSDLVVPNVTTSGLQVGDVALAYSCEAQSVFQVTGFAGGVIAHATTAGVPGNANDNLGYTYRLNAEVLPMQTVIYYIRQGLTAGAGTSLWRRVALNDPEELVEGVEQMQLEFGVDTSGDSVVDSYVTADAVTDWGSVYSVRVALLQRSLQEYGTDVDTRTYQLLNEPIVAAPGDRRLREIFSTTASIRNRVPVN
jgi:type IV pilus assembly protein PilW